MTTTFLPAEPVPSSPTPALEVGLRREIEDLPWQ